MLSNKTIEDVKDVPLVDVISKFLKLEKNGSHYKCLSPFTEEKSPSFVVSPSKNKWKCFSSGHGGNGSISFVMKKENINFLEAVIKIADHFNIVVEYDNSDKAKKEFLKREKVQTLNTINQEALNYFISNIDKLDPDFVRATQEMTKKFSLGYAPTEWIGLYEYLLKKGFSNQQMFDAGLVSKKGNSYYDFFMGRVIFPIYDYNGAVIGFSGRLATKQKEGENKLSKIINTKETESYNKSASLLGIFQSKKSISENNEAVIVEGNYDITSFHQEGIDNTVASLGTAITLDHIKLIKKDAKHITFAVDNDEAGLKKVEANTKLCLTEGLGVSLFIPEGKKQDPDELVKSKPWTEGEFKKYFSERKIDALDYLSEDFFKDCKTTIQEANAEQRLVDLLVCISDVRLRNKYVKKYALKFNIDKEAVEKSISLTLLDKKTKEASEKTEFKLPKGLDITEIEDFKELGFFPNKNPEKIGYYFQTQFGVEKVTNWLIRPLFQVLNESDSKRFIELKTSSGEIVVEIPNKSINNPQSFEEIISNKGGYFFHGTKKQYQRLKSKFLLQFPVCLEIRTLGWNISGFFSFSNGIVVDSQFKAIDLLGIVRFGRDSYFLPAFSLIYKHIPIEDDYYESDRKFIYKSKGMNFENWSRKYCLVYKEDDNGMIAIGFLVASLFSDFIFVLNNNFPILFLFGQPRTGKTSCGRSLSRVFKSDTTPFNLNGGTRIAFQRILARARNIIEHLDEYQNNLDEDKFQAIKGIFDRTGHEKGVKSNDTRTSMVKTFSTAIVSGQHLPTRDNNSLFTRSVMLYFTKLQQEFTNDEIKYFNELAQLETEGLSDVIIEVLKYRSLIEASYTDTQYSIESQMKNELHEAGALYDGRVLKNYVVLLSCVNILSESLKFPFSYQAMYKRSKEMILVQSQQIQESDQLVEFFKQVEYLSLQNLIRVRQDYKLMRGCYSLKIGRKERMKIVNFPHPIDILFLKFSRIFPLYKESIKRQGIIGLDEQTILSYMKTHKAYLGSVAVIDFDGHKTSGYAFIYNSLDINLQDIGVESEETKTTNPNDPSQAAQSPLSKGATWREENTDEELPF